MRGQNKKNSLLQWCTMSPHIGSYLEPFVGESTSFDIINIDDNKLSATLTLNIISEIENLRQHVKSLLELTVKSIGGTSPKTLQTVIDSFDLMSP